MFYHQCDNDKTHFENVKLSIKIYWSILEILCIKFCRFPMEDFENKTQISINKITILKLEKSCFAKHFLFFATLLGTSMLVGDGILTPCVSNIWLAKLIIFILEVHYITFIHSLSLLHFHPPVLSAVGGIKKATSTITNGIFTLLDKNFQVHTFCVFIISRLWIPNFSLYTDKIVWIAASILVFLFMIQRFGIQKIWYTFSPIFFTWFVLIVCIGLYNITHFDPTILGAINPWYIIDYFRRNKKAAWMTLGGTILCTTCISS